MKIEMKSQLKWNNRNSSLIGIIFVLLILFFFVIAPILGIIFADEAINIVETTEQPEAQTLEDIFLIEGKVIQYFYIKLVIEFFGGEETVLEQLRSFREFCINLIIFDLVILLISFALGIFFSNRHYSSRGMW